MPPRYALSFALFALVFTLAPTLHAQSFTRVTTGPVATHSDNSLGVAWGDYDDDGDPDLFVANGGQPSRLYRNDGDGTFSAVANGPVVTTLGDSRGSVWADYDNDGDLDLYVSNRGGNVPPPVTQPAQANFLYRNDGPPTFGFTRVNDMPPATEANFTWSSSWVDYDNDGDLDLHVPDNLHAADDFFYENDGSGQFTSVTPTFVEPGSEPSTGVASWIDFDGDGDQDLLLAKSGRFLPGQAENHRLFRGLLADTGTLGFEEVTTGGVVTHFDNDFQASWGDYDNDGDPDLFLGHAGGPRGVSNYLYRNDGDGVFTAITSGPVVTDTDGTLGSGWGDYDNDGDLDLLVANGGLDKLYRNDGDGTFTSMTSADVGSIVSTSGNSWGAAWADYDNDGFLDAVVVNAATGPGGNSNALYRNTATNGNHWINIRVVGTTSNRSGIGAVVRVKATISDAPTWQTRYIMGSPTGDRSQDDLRAHFGLGDATEIDSVVVAWPSGAEDVYEAVGSNAFFRAVEGGDLLPVASEDASVPSGDEAGLRLDLHPNPARDRAALSFTLARPGVVRVRIYDVLGRIVRTPPAEQHAAGEQQVTLDVAGLPAGVYLIAVEAGGQRRVERMVRL
ncbi:MAG: FG-GAP-like repeat-containing protein [Rhodothermales bacterium]